MTEKKTLLSVKDLKKHFPLNGSIFPKKRRVLRAVDGISLEIYEGETYGLVGESGCGKSTFGRTLLQLTRPTFGEVTYLGKGEGVELTGLKGRELRALRRDLQIILQDPYSALNPKMTVEQLILEGVATHGLFQGDRKKQRAHVLETMEKCGLQGYVAGRYPHQFSGGQRQRVCIARALALQPKFVVCDECVSALDVSVQSQILNLLTELKEREKLTYLFISHDLSVVRHLSDRIGVMYLGKIVEWGSASAVFDTPAHPYTAALVSAVPSLEEKPQKRIVLQGSPPDPAAPPLGCPFHPRCFMAQECCERIPAPLKRLGNGHFSACHFAEKLFFAGRGEREEKEKNERKFTEKR